uniref:Uncharacterized protein n=1 Tax=Anopheles atroparvus TaxID=41427 RepID=A0AAG5D586_ANOAO
MITKLRLSDNASLGDISTNSICDRPAVPGGDSNSEEPASLDGTNSDDQCTSDRQWIGHSRQEWSGRKKSIPGLLASDDSCNAVYNKLREEDKETSECRESIDDSELSFNGKIKPLEIDPHIAVSNGLNTAASAQADGAMSCELIDATKGFERTNAAQEDDTNAARTRKDRLNESFELLTKENSSWIHYKNEKSPDLFADDDNETDDANEERNSADTENDDPDEDADVESLPRSNKRSSGFEADYLDCAVEDVSTKSDTIERVFLKRLQSSLSGVPPPPSLTYSNMDIGSMLALYHSNEEQWWNEYRRLKSTPKDAATLAVVGREGDCSRAKPLPECLSKPTHLTKELSAIGWPELMRYRAHGLHYNKSTVSEKMELLGLKYIERYIGAESSSSFNMALSPSSAKKRNQRMKMLNQSPGSRLSHLARRRAIFSSANLLNSSGGSGTSAGSIVSASRSNITASAMNRLNPFRLCNRQVLLDPKKSDNRRNVKTNKVKTPQRRSPALGRKSPRRRTPGSSAKKLSLARTSASAKPSQQLLVPATVESSKRALFLSPANGAASSDARYEKTEAGSSSSKQTDRSIFSEARMLKSKRSLFSPPRGTADDAGGPLITTTSKGKEEQTGLFGSGTPSSAAVAGVSMKRRRSPSALAEDREPGMSDERTEKIRRTESSALADEDLTPRSLKFARSQSFCVGSQTVGRDCAPIIGGKSLFRANSEITSEDGNRPVMMLTENHKKKLLWAVSQALKDKQVPTKHENFKQHASNLARVVKRLFLEFNDQTISSTSEKLLRLANKHVFEVIQGKSVDDIYFREKTRILNARNLTKLQGYIAPQEYELRKLRRAGSMTSMASSTDGASPFDSQLSASQTFLSQSSSIFSQGSFVGGSFTQLSTEVASGSMPHGRQPKAATSTGSVNTVGVGGALGSNHITTALRENIDSELRQRSTQKLLSFSGKDQKNVSPYRLDKGGNPVVGSNANANYKLLVGGAHNSSIMKAKRQISFE